MALRKTKIGRFEIQEEIGRGAMGVVYRALDPEIGRVVAIKTIKLDSLDEAAGRGEMIARFQREARLAGSLSHPNIVTIYDAGKDKGLYYIAMEYIDGSTLKRLLETKKLTGLDEKLRIFQAACDGLAFAHQNGVIHRDVKPGNILLTKSGQVKLSDFGVARLTASSTLTQAGSVIGTVAYMSPEQIRGQDVDTRSDIFSLGIVFYELLTGERPFAGYSPTTVMHKVVNEHPVPPQILHQNLPRGLGDIVMKALDKEPTRRYSSCAELTHDLRAVAAQQGIALPQTTSSIPAMVLPHESTDASGSIARAVQLDMTESRSGRRAPAPARRSRPAVRPVFLWALAAALLLLLVGGGYLVLQSGGAAPGETGLALASELAPVPQPAVAIAPAAAAPKPVVENRPEPLKPAPAPPVEILIPLEQLDAPPQLQSRTEPTYPPQALQQRLAGKTFARLILAEDGRVESAQALPTDTPQALKDAFVDAVRSWKYLPGRKGGRAVRTEIVETYDFVLPPEPVKIREGDLLSLAEVTTAPRLERAVTPTYPKSAQETGLEGTVFLSALVNERGEVASSTVLSNSVADPALRQAASEAVRGYRYAPAEKDGVKVKVYVEIPVGFKLERQTEAKPQVREGDLVALTDDMIPPRATVKVPPVYPSVARRLRQQGTVIVRALVDETGTVTETSLIRGFQHLNQPALEAVKRWKFEPAVKDGKRVKVYTTVAVDFRLPS